MVKGKKVKFFEGFEFTSWLDAIGSVAIMVLVIVVVFGGTIFLLVNGNKTAYAYEETVTYYVEQGDTLWTIARRYSNTERQDVRRVIDMIEEINDCSATIYPGDALEIPVFTCTGGHD